MKKLLTLLLAFALAWPASAATRSVTFAVQGWSCGSCAAATGIALKTLDGVEDVKTDVENAEAVVTYDDTKVTPERMVQAIAKLGYRAAIKAAGAPSASTRSQTETAADAPGSRERVSFFEVPLECGAAAGLRCGSLSKSILASLERDARIAEAKINSAGTVLVVVWKDAAQAGANDAVVDAAFEKRKLEAIRLQGSKRDQALENFGLQLWYGAKDVDRLSEREAQVIASRIVNRARHRLDLAPERLAALTRDLAAVIARHLTRESEQECAVGIEAIEEELTKAASKHLTRRQLTELRKAGEKGIQALPAEEK